MREQYRAVFTSLQRWRVLCVTNRPGGRRDAAERFEPWWSASRRTLRRSDALSDTTIDRLLEDFRVRRAHDAKQWTALTSTALDQLRASRQRFGADCDAWYAQWRIGGDAAVRTQLDAARSEGLPTPETCEAYQLPFHYGAFDVSRITR